MSARSLSIKEDIYNGVIISTKYNLCYSLALLTEQLPELIKEWQSQGKQAIWAQIDLSQATWVPVFAANGFVFHHAKEDYVMMTRWIHPTAPSTLPRYAFTTIGVGGVVMSVDGQYLLMKERKGHTKAWKFAGGLADPGEDLYSTAIREVQEETGVLCVADHLLLFRHSLGSFKWGCDDIYCLVALRPSNQLPAADNPPKPCPRETAQCKWFTKEQIDQIPDDEFYNLQRQAIEIHENSLKQETAKLHCETMTHPLFKRSYKVYKVISNDDKDVSEGESHYKHRHNALNHRTGTGNL